MTRTRKLVRPLPPGLQWRLTAWVAAVLIVAAAAVSVAVVHQTGAQLRGSVDRDVKGDAEQLAHSITTLSPRTPRQAAYDVQRYVMAQGYSATSTLFFATVPGQPTVSNHPEIFGAPAGNRDSAESLATQRAENRQGQTLLEASPGFSDHVVPDVGLMRTYVMRIPLAGRLVLIGVGEPLAAVHSAQHSVIRAFLVSSAAILLLALVASYLAGSYVSAPLRRMATVAARVDAGELAPRMPNPRWGAGEVQVLSESFNRMLDRLTEAFAAQRAFVADASHELRTPLTIISGQLEVLAQQDDPPPNEIRRVEALVQNEVGRMSRLVDDLLLLVRAEQTDFLRPERIEIVPFLTELWDALTLLAERRFELREPPRGTLMADPDRLAQALRNLGRNAIDHTVEPHGLVRLEAEARPNGRLCLAVVDDGPGIPESERERVFERFNRVDAARLRSRGGTGLGLAIVRAIAEAHQGSVRALSGPGGRGARLEVELPGFVAD